MSHLVAPQEEKKGTPQWQGKLPVDHEVPPQVQQGWAGTPVAEAASQTAQKPSWLIPPQEEKTRDSSIGKAPFDRAVERFETELDKHSVRDDGTLSRDDQIRNKQIADSVLTGAAGVTGEDVGVAENKRLV
ncbi:hypothetical protein AcW1_006293 [Taiwanofungus camphoratus]|nr:hypothetical protein AcW2_005047 [Antrodia cinnamomea]KAI0958120.1 hypothetical protein AcW1_006293 [Antrodia cinnamomea]